MARPRIQKVFADLWGNRVRSLLVLASIGIGLFAIGVIGTIYIVGPQDMERGYAATNPANVTIQAAPFGRCPAEHVGGLAQVREVQAVRQFSTRLEASPGEWIALDVQAFKDPGQMQINRMRLVEGQWPPKEGEIVLDRYKLADAKAELGDMVTLELPSGKTHQMKLVGIVQDLTIGAYRGASGFFTAPAQAYIDRESLDSLERPYPDLYNNLFVTVQGDSRDSAYLDSVETSVRDRVEECGVEIVSASSRSSHEHPNLFLAKAILAVLAIIGLLVAFLSGFLITNTLQAIMTQQVQQIGILKTVGARRPQIAVIYLLLSLMFGALAFLIAMPLSFLTAFRILDFLTLQMNYVSYGARFVPQVALLEGVIAVLMPQAAALAPVWSGTRISVQEALSGYTQSNPLDQGWLDRAISGLRRFSLLLVVALRNTFRRKGRLALTLVTLTLGGAVFISTFNVRVSMMSYVDQLIQYFLADVNVTLDRPYHIDEIRSVIQEVPGVGYVEGWSLARTELVNPDGTVGRSVSLLAPPAGSPLVEPILLKGRWIEPGDRNAIVLNELFMEEFPDLHVGDTLQLRVNEQDTDWVVVGFFQFAGKVSGFSAYTSYQYLSQLLHLPGRAMVYRITADRPDLTRGEQEALGRAIEARLGKKGITVSDISAGQSLTQTASDGFNVVTGFLLFLALLTAAVGSIGLAGAMSLNVMERTREIGILRAIGASDRVLIRILLIEGALIGMISWLLSVAAAFPISRIMSEAISQALFGANSSFGFTYTGFVIWIAVVLVLSVVASVIPARSAARLTIREVLTYE
jgi:putative ABC transport system permease protein